MKLLPVILCLFLSGCAAVPDYGFMAKRIQGNQLRDRAGYCHSSTVVLEGRFVIHFVDDAARLYPPADRAKLEPGRTRLYAFSGNAFGAHQVFINRMEPDMLILLHELQHIHDSNHETMPLCDSQPAARNLSQPAP